MRVIGVLLTLYSLLVSILAMSAARGLLVWAVMGGAVAGLIGGSQLVFWRQQGFGPAFVGTGLFSAIGLGFLAVRVSFMVKYGGMEGPGGFGSPLAFLIGPTFEQLMFTLPAVGLLLALRREHRLEAGASRAPEADAPH